MRVAPELPRGLQPAFLRIPDSRGCSTQHVLELLEIGEVVGFPSKLARSPKLLEGVSLGYQALRAQEEVNLMHIAK